MPTFLHVDENAGQPDPEHPIQGALPDLKLVAQPPTQPPAAFAGAALAGAIDMAATATPATKSDDAFMAISFQILRTANAVPDRTTLFSDFIRVNTKLREAGLRSELTCLLDAAGGINDGREAVGPVMTVAGEAADPRAIPAQHQPIAVVLDFVNPARAGRRTFHLRRQARCDEAGPKDRQWPCDLMFLRRRKHQRHILELIDRKLAHVNSGQRVFR